MNKDEIENIASNFLSDKNEISFAYIFGSFNSSMKYNDIDIAVYIKPDFEYKDLNLFPFGYASELTGNLNLILKTDKIDLVILNDSNLLLSEQVYNTGKLLFERDRFFRVKIENAVRKEYIDTEHFRRIKSYYLHKHLNVQQRSN
jgi:predicted nucleotidyltransferase